MSKLRRPIKDPLTEDIERPINVESRDFPDNQYFTDDATSNAYFTDDNKNNNYVATDP